MLFVVRCLGVCGVSFVAWCLIVYVCCVLCVVLLCVLFVVRCLLCVVC